MSSSKQVNIHSGSGDIITGGDVYKTIGSVTTVSSINFAELKEDLIKLLREGSKSQEFSKEDCEKVDQALNAAEGKDESKVVHILQSLSKFAKEFAKQLSLECLVSLILGR